MAYLSIELGEHLAHVCEFANKKKTLFIQNFMFQLPEGSVTDGQINDVEAVSNALNEALAKKGIKSREVAFTLTSTKVAAREVNYPPVRENRIGSLVLSNVSDYFPVETSNYHISHTVLDKVTSGENKGYRVMVYAVPLVILEGYFNLAVRSGLRVLAIDYTGNTLYRALEVRSGEEVTMYVNVNSTTTFVTFMQGKKMILQRLLSLGADELITNYMSAVGLSDDEYLRALEELSSGKETDILNAMSHDRVEQSLSRLVGNITRTVDYFNSAHWETPVEQLVLSGKCYKVFGLLDELKDLVSFPAMYLENLPPYDSMPNNRAELLAGALSLFGNLVNPVDFMPAEFLKGKGKDKVKVDSVRPAVLFLILSVVLAAGMSFMSVMDYTEALKTNEQLKTDIAALEYTEDSYLTYLDYTNGVKELEVFGGLAVSPNDSLVDFIEELEEKMPREIRVLSAVCSTTGVNMNVTVYTKEQAAMVIVQLRSFESLGQVDVSALAESTDDSGMTLVSFAVSCYYKEGLE